MSDTEPLGGAIVVASPSDLLSTVGRTAGPTPWIDLDQARIDLFAEATGDRQWIHVDVARAAAESPFGGPIAHGYLTLSLVNLFLPDLVSVETFSMGVNVGLDKVRFPAPVPAGSRVRATAEVVEATGIGEGVQVVVRVDIHCEGSDRPSCVADTVSRFFP
ncbi:MAG: MaoC family dehydratase [Microthrixaceae bacterium]